jgi:hypothetical protein
VPLGDYKTAAPNPVQRAHFAQPVDTYSILKIRQQQISMWMSLSALLAQKAANS